MTQVRTSQAAREAVATMEVEEGMSLELALQLPASWPLKPVAIDPRRKAWPSDASHSQADEHEMEQSC